MLVVERGGEPVFDVGTENRFGMILFEEFARMQHPCA
jgi:hypothetical protein